MNMYLTSDYYQRNSLTRDIFSRSNTLLRPLQFSSNILSLTQFRSETKREQPKTAFVHFFIFIFVSLYLRRKGKGVLFFRFGISRNVEEVSSILAILPAKRGGRMTTPR